MLINEQGPDDALSQWEILYRCFPEMRKTGINMGNIHGLPNALTLIMVMATQFSNLRMALIPTVNNPISFLVIKNNMSRKPPAYTASKHTNTSGAPIIGFSQPTD